MNFGERIQPLRAAPDTGSGSNPEENETLRSEMVGYLREHGLPRLQKLDLTIFYGRHTSIADAHSLLPSLKGADVFIPEFAAHRPQTEPLLRQVSAGSMKIDELPSGNNISSPFWQEVLRGIHGSSIHIGIADVPLASAEGRDTVEKFLGFAGFQTEIVQKQWSRKAARQIFGARLRRFLQANVDRERYVANNIAPAIARSYESDVTAAERTSLRALIFIGANHSAISNDIRKTHASLKEIFQEQQGERVLSYLDEILNNFRKGIDMTESDMDAVLTESLIDILVSERSLSMSPSELKAFERHMVDAMSDDERETFHNLFKSGDRRAAYNYLENKNV